VSAGETPLPTVAQCLARRLAARGVRRMFGVPGGGSSLDVIEAGAAEGIDFVLTRTESAAAMMAAATAWLSGAPGVALSTKGPGTANAVNGIACASLDRAPLLFLTAGVSAGEQSWVTHQVFDQQAMLAPVVRAASRLEGDGVAREIDALLDATLRAPCGPVLVELTSEAARRRVPDGPAAGAPGSTGVAASATAAACGAAALDAARRLLAGASRPVIVIGLEARTPAAARAVRSLAEALGCPVLATYMAKGVVADEHPLYVGGFTSGAAEAECAGQADLVVCCGLDPVELLRQPWRYRVPIVDIATVRHAVHYFQPDAGLYGPIEQSVSGLGSLPRSAWTPEVIRGLRERMRDTLRQGPGDGLGPQQVVELAAAAAAGLPAWPRIAVDAGAHMFSAMAFWPCRAPHDVLISNGLATMAFALPAAIASALHEPERTAIAFTGDGGLFMCLAELSTAVARRARVVVVVFNDASLSLIDIKQQQRRLPSRGVRWERPDFAAVMDGLGGRGYLARDAGEYRQALQQALQGDGPALIDVHVTPDGYLEQLKALRG
jgi:acetolactate synthase-1/2/3 large subunit